MDDGVLEINEEQVTLTRAQYDSLVEDGNTLGKLYAAGVDNWDGYEYAMSEN